MTEAYRPPHLVKAVTLRQEHWTFYQRPEWQKRLRPAALQRDKWTCQECGKPGNVVDHKIPHRGDMRLALDIDNLQVLCLSCHGRKSRAERVTDGRARASREAD